MKPGMVARSTASAKAKTSSLVRRSMVSSNSTVRPCSPSGTMRGVTFMGFSVAARRSSRWSSFGQGFSLRFLCEGEYQQAKKINHRNGAGCLVEGAEQADQPAGDEGRHGGEHAACVEAEAGAGRPQSRRIEFGKVNREAAEDTVVEEAENRQQQQHV